MKRTPMRRTPMTRRRRAETDIPPAVRAHVTARSQGRCEVEVDGFRHAHQAHEIHHVEKRSKFGRKRRQEAHHPDNLIHLNRACHTWTDVPYFASCGRLVITRLGGGRFRCSVERAANKFEVRRRSA